MNVTKILCVHVPISCDWNSAKAEQKKEEAENQVKALVPDNWKVIVVGELGRTEYKFETIFLD